MATFIKFVSGLNIPVDQDIWGITMRLSSIRLVNEAIYGQNRTATVFHRTKSIDSIKGMLSTGFRPGSGKMYGLGLYTTFDIESQLSLKMVNIYGPYIVKFIVKDLDQYLVFDPDEAKKIHGEGWQLNDQLKKFGISSSMDYDMYRNPFSSDLVLRLYKDVGGEHVIMSKVKGIIFKGRHDSSVLAKFEPVDDGTITMSAYAHSPAICPITGEPLSNDDDFMSADELEWVKSTNKASIKSIYGLKPGVKRSHLTSIGNPAKENMPVIYQIPFNSRYDPAKFDFLIKTNLGYFGSLPDYTYIAGCDIDYDDQGMIPNVVILKVMGHETPEDLGDVISECVEDAKLFIESNIEWHGTLNSGAGLTWNMPTSLTYNGPVW